MSIGKSGQFFLSLLAARLTGRPRPLTAILNLTDRCNLNCAYCYASYPSRRKEEMTLDQVIHVLNRLYEKGCRRVSISGGEPLLRKDLGQILEHTRRLGMLCTVNSNGILVPRHLDILRRIDTLCLSLDGTEATHDRYRGRGSHKAVIRAIEQAGKAGIPTLTNTVLHRYNLKDIDTMIQLAEEKGFRCLFNVSVSQLNTGSTSEYKAPDNEIRQALKKLIRLKQSGAPILTSVEALTYCRNWPDYKREFSYGKSPAWPYIPCQAGKYFITIDTNGDVFPCGHLMDGRFKQGNILTQGLAKSHETAAGHACRACYHIGHTEFNALFNLHPRVILNLIKTQLLPISGRNR